MRAVYEICIGGKYVDVTWANNPAQAIVIVTRRIKRLHLRWARQGTKLKAHKGKIDVFRQ